MNITVSVLVHSLCQCYDIVHARGGRHVFVWKLDLEGGSGGSSPLEVMLAERLMRESALLMRTLLSYVPAEDKETPPKTVYPPRGGVGVASRT